MEINQSLHSLGIKNLIQMVKLCQNVGKVVLIVRTFQTWTILKIVVTVGVSGGI